MLTGMNTGSSKLDHEQMVVYIMSQYSYTRLQIVIFKTPEISFGWTKVTQ